MYRAGTVRLARLAPCPARQMIVESSKIRPRIVLDTTLLNTRVRRPVAIKNATVNCNLFIINTLRDYHMCRILAQKMRGQPILTPPRH